jgi:SNF family Na+-dependent transporter
MPALKGNIIIFDKEDNSIGFVDLYTHSEYLNDKNNINSNSSSSMIYNINISIIALCLLGILLQIKHKLSLTYIK